MGRREGGAACRNGSKGGGESGGKRGKEHRRNTHDGFEWMSHSPTKIGLLVHTIMLTGTIGSAGHSSLYFCPNAMLATNNPKMLSGIKATDVEKIKTNEMRSGERWCVNNTLADCIDG